MNRNKKQKMRILSGIVATAMVLTMTPQMSQKAQAATAKTVTKTVKTQKQLDAALKNKKIGTIIIKNGKDTTYTVKKGTYNVKLTVDASKANVVNNATFKKGVTVEDGKSFKEKADGNAIKIKDSKLSLNIAASANGSKVSVEKKDSTIILKVDGTPKAVNINKKAEVSISGNTKTAVPVTSNANGASISTKTKTDLVLNKQATVTAQKGASIGTVTAKAGADISVQTGAKVSNVAVKGKNSDVKLTVNGTVGKVKVDAKADVAIAGTSTKAVKVEANTKGATVQSSVKTAITVNAEVKVTLTEGAEGSKVTAGKKDVEPAVVNNTKEEVTVTDKEGNKETVNAGESVGKVETPAPEKTAEPSAAPQETVAPSAVPSASPVPSPSASPVPSPSASPVPSASASPSPSASSDTSSSYDWTPSTPAVKKNTVGFKKINYAASANSVASAAPDESYIQDKISITVAEGNNPSNSCTITKSNANPADLQVVSGGSVTITATVGLGYRFSGRDNKTWRTSAIKRIILNGNELNATATNVTFSEDDKTITWDIDNISEDIQIQFNLSDVVEAVKYNWQFADPRPEEPLATTLPNYVGSIASGASVEMGAYSSSTYNPTSYNENGNNATISVQEGSDVKITVTCNQNCKLPDSSDGSDVFKDWFAFYKEDETQINNSDLYTSMTNDYKSGNKQVTFTIKGVKQDAIIKLNVNNIEAEASEEGSSGGESSEGDSSEVQSPSPGSK